MRIACLQFAPQVGDINNNLNRADAVLSKANPEDLDLLVLPELAFTGYNFKSLNEISPFLEPTGAGITSLWARTTALKYNCVVAAGYPEKVDVSPKWPTSPEYYNSLILVNGEGETVANYRKTHLYYTDETWALEGPGFESGHIAGIGRMSLGICMDLNPYKFEAPWSAFEFAFHALDVAANVVVLSMAWLTREDARHFSRMPKEPDMETMTYWIKRLEPLIRAETDEEIIVIFANRTGMEGDAVYAGTSAVIGIQYGEVSVYGLLGRGEKELLVVDTSLPPYAKLVYRPESLSNPHDAQETDAGVSEDAPGSSAPGGPNITLSTSRPTSTTSSTSTSQGPSAKTNFAENASGEHVYRILGGHVFITHDNPTPMSATFPLTPFPDDDSPLSPRYFSISPENLRTPGLEIPHSPTSSTRSNHSESSDIRKGGLLGPRAKTRSFTPRNANTEKHEDFAELINALRNATSKHSAGTPARPSSPKSRNASRTGRGERSDSVLSRRPPSALGNPTQSVVIESDSLTFCPESPKSRNASRNQSRTRALESSSVLSDRRFTSSSRNKNLPGMNLDQGGNRNEGQQSVNEFAIDDSNLARHRSTSPDLEKIGADLLVFEEGARRPRRDSLECHADEDDFIVLHASQRQHSQSKNKPHIDQGASEKAGSARGLDSPSMSSLKSPLNGFRSPLGGRSSSQPQRSPDLPLDSRAVSRGRQRATEKSPRKSSTMGQGERQASSSKVKSPGQPKSLDFMKQNSPGLTERLARSRRDSNQAQTYSGRAILSPKAPSNSASREASRESLAASITTVETKSAPTTPECLPPTPKAMVLSPDWDKILTASVPVIETTHLKCIEQEIDRPKSAVW